MNGTSRLSSRLRPILYSFEEEVSHAITHGLGVALAMVGTAFLMTRALRYGDIWHVVSSGVFGATLILMYAASTVYHSAPVRARRLRHRLRIVDHSLIYFLIAGTYTPFTLVTLHGPWGWSLFALTWSLAIAGVAFKLFATGRFEKLSLAIYLGMGWCALIAIVPLIEALPPPALGLLAAGGLTYSGGVAFYAWRSLRFHHAIWHLFVLAGSVMHYFAVLLYIVPGPDS